MDLIFSIELSEETRKDISSVGIISGYRSTESRRNRYLEYCEDFTEERIMSIAERIGDIGSMQRFGAVQSERENGS